MKASLYTMKLEKLLMDLLVDARKRRAYVHPIAMGRLTPKQYDYAVSFLTKHGYGPNVFPIHHVHPPLSMAIVGFHTDALLSLLKHGADPHLSYPTDNGRTCPLNTILELMEKHIKVDKKYLKLEQMLNTMVAYGANLNKKIHPVSEKTFKEWYDEIQNKKAALKAA